MSRRFHWIVPIPPWEWVPAIEFHKVRPGLYFVALSQAFNGTPGSLYLFEASRYVRVDSGASGVVQVHEVFVTDDRIEVAYFPTPSTSMPVLTSALLEKREGAWHVDHDTPYRRITAS